jgi:hypothetical protein
MLFFEFCEDKSIHFVFDPICLLNDGRGRVLHRHKCPVARIGGTLCDPAAETFGLVRRDRFFHMGRRHYLIRIVAEDPFDHLAPFRFSRHDRLALISRLGKVEPEIGFQ